MGSSPFIRTMRTHPLWVRFLRGADERKDEEAIGSREEGESLTTLSERTPLAEYRRYPSSAL